MNKRRPYWIIGAIAIVAIVVVAILYALPKKALAKNDPWAHVPEFDLEFDPKIKLQLKRDKSGGGGG